MANNGGGGREGPVERALERWVSRGLLEPGLAEVLRADALEVRRAARRRYAQYVVAATGVTLTLIAAAVFLAWSWPHLSPSLRSGVIGTVGVLLVAGGLWAGGARSRAPVAYGLQTAGLGVLLMAYAYSGHAWVNGSPVSLALGAATLIVPLVLAPLTARDNPVMPAVLTALGYAYLFVFLVRGVGLGQEAALWVVDAVLVLSVVVLAVLIWRRGVASDGDGLDGWEPGALTAALYAAPALLLATAAGPLDLGDAAVVPLDLWWLLLTGLTLWMVHAAPPALRRPWIPRQLAWAVVFGSVLVYWTILGALDGPSWAAAGVAGLLGGASLAHGLAHDLRDTVATGCLALVAAAWYYGAEAAGALGAAVALAFTAALLFWVSGRLGRATASEEAAT